MRKKIENGTKWIVTRLFVAVAIFLAICLLAPVVSASANSINYQAITASFPVYVNGSEFKTDKPIVTIDGNTYLPLAALSDSLGVQVSWNAELSRVEIGEDKQQQASYSRSNPAPIGTEQTAVIDTITENYTATVKVSEVIRGSVALDIIKTASQYNADPADGYEYILAKISVTAVDVADDKAIMLSRAKFVGYSSNDVQFDSAPVTSIEPKMAERIFTGGNTEGYVAYLVKKDDQNQKMAFGTKFDGSSGVWFKLQ